MLQLSLKETPVDRAYLPIAMTTYIQYTLQSLIKKHKKAKWTQKKLISAIIELWYSKRRNMQIRVEWKNVVTALIFHI